jgi:membrane peptidoglycan carboxypeptidase
MLTNRIRLTIGLLLLLAAAGTLRAEGLESELGRSEVRVRSAPYILSAGMTVQQAALPERLAQLGYSRVHRKPERPGQYFWGHEAFWIYRRAHRVGGRDQPALLFALRLRKRDGMILGAAGDYDDLWLEPLTLSESLDGDRAIRRPVDLGRLPEHVWRPVLAAEDARFFEHVGLDGRSIARALLANAKAGGVEQGGSTITQQLIKNRDLTPKRSLGRKASEALRALALEIEYDKREILEAYLNQLYLGHVDGLAIHGLGTAAHAYFSKEPEKLTLAEAATLAAMIQGPNRLSPIRHPQRTVERRNWVLQRMEELGWADPTDAAAAAASGIDLRRSAPEAPMASHFLDWVASETRRLHPHRLEEGRGIVVETGLDPYLQLLAERAVADYLRELRASYPKLRSAALSAALVALDADSGMVIAYVGGDPSDRADRFDRARNAERQPGSAIKPLLLLEAFQECGERERLHPATRVADEPLRIELPSGVWEPTNYDDKFSGAVDLRTALRKSLNVPFVRVARWCGPERVAARLRLAGLDIPEDPPISFSLGSLGTNPLQLAGAYAVFATPGRAIEPAAVHRIERPSGRGMSRRKPDRQIVVNRSTAYLIHDLMRDAVANGTGRAARIDGLEVAGKTGTSSSLRDTWFAGDAGGIVTVVWVGLDGNGSLGLTAGRAAAPLWKRFMEPATRGRSGRGVERPGDVVVRRIDPRTGLRLSARSSRGREELFRRGVQPRKRRVLRRNRPEPVIR